jgi:hypothetical protein
MMNTKTNKIQKLREYETIYLNSERGLDSSTDMEFSLSDASSSSQLLELRNFSLIVPENSP